MGAVADYISLAVTILLFVGVIVGAVKVYNLISEGIASTKENLKKQGIHISDHGVEVKTQKHFDREDYIDASQRGFIKVMKAGGFKHEGEPHVPDPKSKSAPSLLRHSSKSSKEKN